MASTVLADLAASGAALFAQNARLLTLRFAEDSGFPEDTLLPHRLTGREGLSKSFRYELSCLCADAHLELKELLGQGIEVSLLLADGSQRLYTGLVTQAQHKGADGGFARYDLTIEPALAALDQRRNSRVFQDQTVPDIVAAILDEHLAANPALAKSFQHRADLDRTYPVRSYCLQYRESDRAFIERLLAEEGISYRYTHGEDDTSHRAADSTPDSAPLHTLVLFDRNASLPDHPQDTLRFHRTDGIETADAIDTWEGSRRLQSGQTQLTTYDYQTVSQYPGTDPSRNRQGDAATDLTASLEDYDPQTGYYGSDPDDMARYAELRQQAKDLAGKTFAGEGSVRGLVPGHRFQLADHPIHDQDAPEDRSFVVTDLDFQAENNLTQEAQSSLGSLLAPSLSNTPDAAQNTPPYRNTFNAVRRDIPLVPAYHRTEHQKPTARGLTTATVVGPAGEEIYTDEHGRIKIQFHWQRPQDHPQGGANLDDHSSTWVRVAMPSAGAQWGSQYIPRIGQEVVIDFIEGDIDRPLATGVVYNGSHRPPTFSGAGQLPANKTLSGHKSKEYKGSRYNELLFDDSTGEIRTKLSSEHGKSQLNQGYLIHPRTDGKGDPRGEGFELRTDEAGALRAAKGILISAWQRLNASGKQLSREETLGLMEQSLALFKQLGEYAQQHQADPIDPEPHQQLNQAVTDWEQGSNTQKDGSGQGGTPAIAITAPKGIHTSTPESQVSYAGKNIDTVAQQHLQQTAGQRYNLNAGKGISLFAHAEGLKAIAHHGPLLLQSQHDDTVVNAEQNIRMTASQGKISLMAQEKVSNIIASGAYVTLDGPNINFGGPGGFTIKAAAHNWIGPSSMVPDLPAFSEGVCKECLLKAMKEGGAVLPRV